MKLTERELVLLRRLIYEAYKKDCFNVNGTIEDLVNLDKKILNELSKIENRKNMK